MSYVHYKQVDGAAEELDTQEKFEEELALLQSAEEQFPEYRFQNLRSQALVLRQIGQYDKCYEIIATLIQQGYFMPLGRKYFEPLQEKAGFAFLQEESERLKAKAQAQARMEYAIHLPEGYDAGKVIRYFLCCTATRATLINSPGTGRPNRSPVWDSWQRTCNLPRCGTAGAAHCRRGPPCRLGQLDE